jgi:hypothetical protein
MAVIRAEWRKHTRRFLADLSELREAKICPQTSEEAQAIEEAFRRLDELAARLRHLDEKLNDTGSDIRVPLFNDPEFRHEGLHKSNLIEMELIFELVAAMVWMLSNIGWRDAVNQDISYLKKAENIFDGIGRIEYSDSRCRFKFIHSGDIASQFIVNNRHVSMFDVLTVFIGIAHEECGIACGRVSFICDKAYLPAMNALASSGYARKIQDRFYWTMIIAPIMKELMYWDESLISWEEVLELDLEACALLALRTMPNIIVTKYFSPPAKSIDLLRVITRCWREDQWQRPVGASWVPGYSFELAHRMVQIAQGKLRGEHDI